jgi:dihydroorotate dehydrogenase electron transfer subunit
MNMQPKGPFEAIVAFNKPLRKCFYRMGLQFTGPGAEAFAKARPGQFAEFDLSNVALPAPEAIPDELKDAATKKILLRRPFSFARVVKEAAPSSQHGTGPSTPSTAHPPTGSALLTTSSLGAGPTTPSTTHTPTLLGAGPSTHLGAGKTTVEVIYCVLGPATLRMTTLTKGNSISVIGPLGNGFSVPQGKKKALLVAGGMGSPPLEHLAQTLTAENSAIDTIAFAGANSLDVMPFEKPLDKISRELGFWLGEFAKYSIQSFVATDDGSAGFKGLVSDCLVDWLKQNNIDPLQTIIYACGPRPMLAKIASIARDKKIDCQVSMEEMMACGIGLCQSCAIKCKVVAGGKAPTPGQTINKLCCKDGPVFDSKDVVF